MFAVRGTEATYEFVDLQKCDDSLLFFVLIDNDLMYFDFGLLVIQNKLKTVFVFSFIFGCFQDKEGGFVVRESSQKGVYTVSVYTKTLRCFKSQLKQTHHKFTHEKYLHIYLSFFWLSAVLAGTSGITRSK